MATRKTNRGIVIDIDSLIASASPNQPAVGNMGVNAKGDVLGREGKIIKKNEERVREQYKNSNRKSNPKVSLKGSEPSKKIAPDTTVEEEKVTAPAPVEEPVVTEQPEEFDAPEGLEPLGFKEVELDNGDIEMVPYYKDDK